MVRPRMSCCLYIPCLQHVIKHLVQLIIIVNSIISVTSDFNQSSAQRTDTAVAATIDVTTTTVIVDHIVVTAVIMLCTFLLYISSTDQQRRLCSRIY